jgi:hypothetical protein
MRSKQCAAAYFASCKVGWTTRRVANHPPLNYAGHEDLETDGPPLALLTLLMAIVLPQLVALACADPATDRPFFVERCRKQQTRRAFRSMTTTLRPGIEPAQGRKTSAGRKMTPILAGKAAKAEGARPARANRDGSRPRADQLGRLTSTISDRAEPRRTIGIRRFR